ncbi:MAG: hypothetical protein AAFV80_08475 [Bacteroidota bacterium]
MSEQSSFSSLRDPQTIVAVGVTIISLCALFVSLQQTRIMKEERELIREYSRASVWPRLEMGVNKGHNSDGSIKKLVITLGNSGVGPAIITDVRVAHKDQTATDWWDLFNVQEIPDSIDTNISNSSFNGRIVKIDETIEIINLNGNPSLGQAFFERLGDFSIEVYYESIYGEKWKYEVKNLDDSTVKLEDFAGLPEEDQFNN